MSHSIAIYTYELKSETTIFLESQGNINIFIYITFIENHLLFFEIYDRERNIPYVMGVMLKYKLSKKYTIIIN